MTVREFTDELSSDSPAPGGGSVAALVGSLGAALGFLAAYCVFAWYYVSRARPFFAEVEGWE